MDRPEGVWTFGALTAALRLALLSWYTHAWSLVPDAGLVNPRSPWGKGRY